MKFPGQIRRHAARDERGGSRKLFRGFAEKPESRAVSLDRADVEHKGTRRGIRNAERNLQPFRREQISDALPVARISGASLADDGDCPGLHKSLTERDASARSRGSNVLELPCHPD